MILYKIIDFTHKSNDKEVRVSMDRYFVFRPKFPIFDPSSSGGLNGLENDHRKSFILVW